MNAHEVANVEGAHGVQSKQPHVAVLLGEWGIQSYPLGGVCRDDDPRRAPCHRVQHTRRRRVETPRSKNMLCAMKTNTSNSLNGSRSLYIVAKRHFWILKCITATYNSLCTIVLFVSSRFLLNTLSFSFCFHSRFNFRHQSIN